MWTCPKCHQEIEDSVAICESCGASIDDLLTESAEPEKMPAIPTSPRPRTTPRTGSTPKPRSTPKPQPRSSSDYTPSARKGSTPKAISKTTDASSATAARRSPKPIRRGSAPGSAGAPNADDSEAKGLSGSGDLSSMREDSSERLGSSGFASSEGSTLNSTGLGSSSFKDDSTYAMYNESSSDALPPILGGAADYGEEEGGSFKPLPPFVSAFEADRPSPFAPAKKDASAKSETPTPAPAPSPKPQSSRDAHTLRMDAGEIATSSKPCPVCGTRCLLSEKNCRNCGYQFSNNSVFSKFEDKHINILAILAAIAMAASVFVNFITYTIENAASGADDVIHVALINKVDGYAFLLLAALTLVLGFFGRHKLVVTMGVLSVIAVCIENYLLYYDITQVKKGGHIDNEIGFYLLAAGAALILIAGIYALVQEKKKRDRYTEQFNASAMYR